MSGDPFAPLGGGGGSRGGGRQSGSGAAAPAVMPVPPGAPAPPTRHRDLGEPTATWTYRDASGGVTGYVHRFDLPDGKQFRPLVLFRDGDRLVWRWVSWPAPRPLYGLDRLAAAPAAPVVLCEGEKAADAAGKLLTGYVAVASPNGSKSAGKADWSPLRGRAVTIWRDADDAGDDYANSAAGCLAAIGAASVAIVVPPTGCEPGWDAADALARGWSAERALGLIRTAIGAKPRSSPATSAGSADGGDPPRRRPQRDSLMGLT